MSDKFVLNGPPSESATNHRVRKLSSLIEWVALLPIQLLTIVWANQLIEFN